MDEGAALERDILVLLNVKCYKDGCGESKKTMFRPTSHNRIDANSIKVDFCAAGHMYSVCPRYRCRLLNANRAKTEKNKEWVKDCKTETEGQKILWCESCRFENSVIMACQSCFDAAGRKVTLEDLCDSCLMKTCFDSANEQTYLQEIRSFCCLKTLSKDSLDTRSGARWIFRKTSKNSKKNPSHLFEQCSPVSVSKDGKYVTIQRLSDNKEIYLKKRIRSSLKPLAMRPGCKVIERKRRGKRGCPCQAKALASKEAPPATPLSSGISACSRCTDGTTHDSPSQQLVSSAKRKLLPAESAVLAKQTKLGVNESDFEWPKSLPTLLRIIFRNLVMSFCA